MNKEKELNFLMLITPFIWIFISIIHTFSFGLFAGILMFSATIIIFSQQIMLIKSRNLINLIMKLTKKQHKMLLKEFNKRKK